MTDNYIWRTCRHCNVQKFCSEKTMIEHEEDCPQRPSQKKKIHICPKCHEGVLSKVLPGSWICSNESCDFQLDEMEGGKLQS